MKVRRKVSEGPPGRVDKSRARRKASLVVSPPSTALNGFAGPARCLSIVNEIALAVGEASDLHEVFDLALIRVLDLTGIESGTVWMIDPSRQELITCAHRGIPQEVLDAVKGLKVGEGLAGQVALTGEPLIVTDLEKDPRLTRRAVVQAGYRFLASFPWKVRSRVLGGMNLISRFPHTMSDEQIQMLLSISEIIGVTVENARLYRDLAQSEAKYRSIFENAVEGIFQSTPDGRLIAVNPAAARIFGYDSPEELMAAITNIAQQMYVNPEHRTLFARLLKEHGIVRDFQTEEYRKDGKKIWVSLSARAVRDETGRILYYEGFVEDITERKRAEADLRQTEQRYRALFEEAPVMYVITRDQEGTPVITDCNQLFLQTLGYSREEVIERPLTDFYTPESQARLRQGGYERALRGEFIAEERDLIARDGRIIQTLLRAVPERDAEGRVSGTRAMYVDITERKAMEAALRVTTDQLTAVTRAMAVFLESGDWNEASDILLDAALRLTQSEDGFVAAVAEGPNLHLLACKVAPEGHDPLSLASLEESRRGYDERGFVEKCALRNLLDYIIATGQPVLTNNPTADRRFRGVPKGHPRLNSFLGIPILQGQEVVGIIGVANRPGGYTEGHQEVLDVLIRSTAVLFDGYRRRQRQVALEAEREQALEALRRSQHQYQTLVESMSEVLLQLDLDGRVTYVNSAVTPLTGYRPEELVGKRIYDIVHPEDVEKVRRLFSERLQGATHSVDTRVVTRTGEVRYVRSSGRPIFEGDRPVGVTSLVRDITEQYRADRQLTRIYEVVTRYHGEELFDRAVATIAELLRMPFVVAGEVMEDGRSAIARVFYRRGAVEHGRQYSLPGMAVERVVREGRLVVYSNRAWEAFPDDPDLTSNRSECYIGAPIMDATGQVIGALCAFSDHPKEFSRTEIRIIRIVAERLGAEILRKRSEETQRKLQQQLLHAQKMESVGTLAGGIAHDFNNLLTGIMGFTEVALRKLGPTHPIAEYHQRVLALCERARDLIKQLLLFSRPTTGEKKRCCVRHFLEEIEPLLRRIIPENIEIKMVLPPPDLIIEADPSQLQQVIVNLAVNARDAMGEGGRLDITAESVRTEVLTPPIPVASGTQRFVRLTVSDTGEGIPPEILPHIFEPFFTTKEVGKGTGLGLSVVYGIIKAHGGWVDVESTV
ncbi:MAG TPA: PAS domain S-box protein, partial [Blastocatellia bacterium]|nr:PAS domain S-box protein [Blastocatellia bacterium]